MAPPAHDRQPHADRGDYLKMPGDTAYTAFKLDVLRIVADRIAEITTFGPALFPQLGLPKTLER